MTPKKATQYPKPLKSQYSKTSQDPSPHKMLWSQQVELEEEARLHSSDHMPNKMLSLYYDPFADILKTREFYEHILVEIGLVKINHNVDKYRNLDLIFSTCHIFKILTVKQ